MQEVGGGLTADSNLGAPTGQARFHRGDQAQAIANQGLSKVRNEELNEPQNPQSKLWIGLAAHFGHTMMTFSSCSFVK